MYAYVLNVDVSELNRYSKIYRVKDRSLARVSSVFLKSLYDYMYVYEHMHTYLLYVHVSAGL